MKKKNIIIISSILVFIIIILLILFFINNLKKDKKIEEENIDIINKSYNNLKLEVENYNNVRKNIATFINNFYYDTIEDNYQNNLEILNNYDAIVNKITNEVKILDSKCDNGYYSNTDINVICNSYKNDYEIIVNVFINDINNYNNKLNSYNKDNNKNLELFNSLYIEDYIDYNKDNIYSKKDVQND